MEFVQNYNPLGNAVLSTVVSALPVVVLFWMLVIRRSLAPTAAAAGAATAFLLAVTVYGMPAGMAGSAFLYGCAFGLLPIAWVVFNAMLLYNLTVVTGKFEAIRASVAGLSPDHRIQAVVIGFSFGAFLEGAAGGGTPVAICGALLVGLGFNPFMAACLCLIANTSPVAYGGLGTPILVLGQVTGLDVDKLSIAAGSQLPLLSCIIPLWMVWTMAGFRRTWEVLPAVAVAGGSFAVCQWWFAHQPYPLFGLCDLAGGIFSLVCSAVFLKFWRPKEIWRYDTQPSSGATGGLPASVERSTTSTLADKPPVAPADTRAKPASGLDAEARAVMEGVPAAPPSGAPLTAGRVFMGWLPFAIMFLTFVLLGFFKESVEGAARFEVTAQSLTALADAGVPAETVEKLKPLDGRWFANKNALALHVTEVLTSAETLAHRDTILKHAEQTVRKDPLVIAGVPVVVRIPIPGLHDQVVRGEDVLSAGQRGLPDGHRERESAVFTFNWLTTPGTLVLASTLLSLVFLRPTFGQMATVVARTIHQMRIPVPTIAVMMGLGFITRYAGLDATLGLAFTHTGFFYPFFAALLGWLGVFLTGTDASSNALFGSLQKITAQSLDLNPVLIAAANSTGGVMGKMIDAQSICVATAATDQIGKEADIFKFVIWHSFVLASIIGIIVMLQAYVFTGMVPWP